MTSVFSVVAVALHGSTHCHCIYLTCTSNVKRRKNEPQWFSFMRQKALQLLMHPLKKSGPSPLIEYSIDLLAASLANQE